MNKLNKKNIKFILLFFALIIIVFAFFYCKNLKNIDLNNFETYPDENLITSNFGNDQIEKAIVNYLLTEKNFSWKNREDSHVFCTIKNLKPEKELFPFYIWACCGEYIIENNELKTISGSSLPAKIDYPNELSYYDLNKFSYEVPGDGADYTKDIKRIFPQDVQQKIFDHNIQDIITKAENFAFTNISAWNSIKKAVSDCEVKSIMQTHDLTVRAKLKSDVILEGKEPKIDEIFDIVDENKEKCGEIIMGTE